MTTNLQTDVNVTETKDWKADLRDSLAEALAQDPFWSQQLAAVEAGIPTGPALHLAILVEPYLQLILDGRKTVESRFSMNRCAPYKAVAKGDVIVLKRAGGPIVGLCEVDEAWFFQLDQPGALETIQRDFEAAICPQEGFWEARTQAKVATLMRVAHVTPLASLGCGKRDRRGWSILGRSGLGE